PDRLHLVTQAAAIFRGDAVGIAFEQRDNAVDRVPKALEHDHHVPEACAAFAFVLALYLSQGVSRDVAFVWLWVVAVAAAIGLARGCGKLLLDAFRRPQRVIEPERAGWCDDTAALAFFLAGIVRGAGDAVRLADVAGIAVGIGRCAQALAECSSGRG